MLLSAGDVTVTPLTLLETVGEAICCMAPPPQPVRIAIESRGMPYRFMNDLLMDYLGRGGATAFQGDKQKSARLLRKLLVCVDDLGGF